MAGEMEYDLRRDAPDHAADECVVVEDRAATTALRRCFDGADARPVNHGTHGGEPASKVTADDPAGAGHEHRATR